jgi:hypothetical protein
MKTLIDVRCPSCQRVTQDVWRIGGWLPVCPGCGGMTERCWTPIAVHGEVDVVIRHGLCHPDGTPRRFESRQSLARAARAAGLTNAVAHTGVEGSDKSPETQRFL